MPNQHAGNCRSNFEIGQNRFDTLGRNGVTRGHRETGVEQLASRHPLPAAVPSATRTRTRVRNSINRERVPSYRAADLRLDSHRKTCFEEEPFASRLSRLFSCGLQLSYELKPPESSGVTATEVDALVSANRDLNRGETACPTTLQCLVTTKKALARFNTKARRWLTDC